MVEEEEEEEEEEAAVAPAGGLQLLIHPAALPPAMTPALPLWLPPGRTTTQQDGHPHKTGRLPPDEFLTTAAPVTGRREKEDGNRQQYDTHT